MEGAVESGGGGDKGSSSRFRRVCVFCGSSSGKRSSYRDAAVELGRELVARKVDLVYGGGSVGLMGEVSEAVHKGGGHVIGSVSLSQLIASLRPYDLPPPLLPAPPILFSSSSANSALLIFSPCCSVIPTTLMGKEVRRREADAQLLNCPRTLLLSSATHSTMIDLLGHLVCRSPGRRWARCVPCRACTSARRRWRATPTPSSRSQAGTGRWKSSWR